MPPAEGGEVTLLPTAVLGCLGQEQVAGVVQERTLVEVPLEAAGEKTHLLLLQVRTIAFLDKPVLLVHDTIGRQYLDCLHPSRMDGRSEEHTSELQSRQYLVCRLLLEKK